MGLFRWLYQNVFQREYPLISIPRFPYRHVPYATFSPNEISLTFSKLAKEVWQITDDDISNIIEAILEHEYLHLILDNQINSEANHQLNNIHRFLIPTNELIWEFRDGKTFGHTQDLWKKADEVYRNIKKV
jgi:hypothetical protein